MSKIFDSRNIDEARSKKLRRLDGNWLFILEKSNCAYLTVFELRLYLGILKRYRFKNQKRTFLNKLEELFTLGAAETNVSVFHSSFIKNHFFYKHSTVSVVILE